MTQPIDVVTKHRVGVRAALLWMACALAPSLAGAQSTSPIGAASIDAITLERNGVAGAATSLLVLRRDGSASLVETGNARQGGEDKTSAGRVRKADFAALARLVVARRFFALDESYEDPQLRDGAWATVGVSTATQKKQVFRREDAGPAALKEIEAEIDAVGARISFVPAPR